MLKKLLDKNIEESNLYYELDPQIDKKAENIVKSIAENKNLPLERKSLDYLSNIFDKKELAAFKRAFGDSFYLDKTGQNSELSSGDILIVKTGFSAEQMKFREILDQRKQDMGIVFENLKKRNIGVIEVEIYEGFIGNLAIGMELGSAILINNNVAHYILTNKIMEFIGVCISQVLNSKAIIKFFTEETIKHKDFYTNLKKLRRIIREK